MREGGQFRNCPQYMKLQDFAYDLPEELIAQHPLVKRDQARLLIVDRSSQTIRHDYFCNISQYLPNKSVLVVNNSKVIPARLLGHREKSGGAVEIFLLKKLDDYSYETLMRPLKKVAVDEKLIFGQGVWAQLKNKEQRIVRFNRKNILKYLAKIGHTPLPPYIKRADNERDRKDYQTVYARHAGSVASPTAGLHFTKALLTKLKHHGHTIAPLTLHVNYGTFKPVEAQDITEHKMHAEEFLIPALTLATVKGARQKGRRVVAVGTTSCRVLETVAPVGQLKGSTDIYIYPGFNFKFTDILVTNFHLPFSSLLILVYAFGGMDLIKRAYAEAIREKYRFYSYGDAMVIL